MRCLLDLDGVLVGFTAGVHRAFNLPYDYFKLPRPSPYFIFEAIGLTVQEIDKICTTSFWANLPWMHDGRDILREILNQLDPSDIFLCTTPMPNPESVAGKVLWVRKNLPAYESRLIVTTAPKATFAPAFPVLIDDRDENILEFNEAGGLGILCPRPWNSLHQLADNPIPQLQKFQGRMCPDWMWSKAW